MDQARLNELKCLYEASKSDPYQVLSCVQEAYQALPELIEAYEGLGKDYEALYSEHANLINTANVKTIENLKAEVERLQTKLNHEAYCHDKCVVDRTKAENERDRLRKQLELAKKQRDEWLNTDYKGDEIHLKEMDAELEAIK